MAFKPPPSHGRRSAAISSARAARRISPRSNSNWVRGCFNKASRRVGSKSLVKQSMMRSINAPGTVLAKGRPPESSTLMPHASSRMATRRAKRRSGVMRAAVLPGSSAVRRRIRAMVSASSCGSRAMLRVMFSKAVCKGVRGLSVRFCSAL